MYILSLSAQLSARTHTELDKLTHRLIRLAALVTDTQLRQNILFMLVTLADRSGWLCLLSVLIEGMFHHLTKKIVICIPRSSSYPCHKVILCGTP